MAADFLRLRGFSLKSSTKKKEEKEEKSFVVVDKATESR